MRAWRAHGAFRELLPRGFARQRSSSTACRMRVSDAIAAGKCVVLPACMRGAKLVCTLAMLGRCERGALTELFASFCCRLRGFARQRSRGWHAACASPMRSRQACGAACVGARVYRRRHNVRVRVRAVGYAVGSGLSACPKLGRCRLRSGSFVTARLFTFTEERSEGKSCRWADQARRLEPALKALRKSWRAS